MNSMTDNSTTLHYKSEFLKRSWNSRSYLIFVLSCRLITLEKQKITNGEKIKTDVEISGSTVCIQHGFHRKILFAFKLI